MKKLIFIFFLIPILGFTQPVTDGLVGYWPFNGNANDESGNGNDGIVNGAILTMDRFGNANSAYHFDGDEDFINVPNNSSVQLTSGFTISAWVKLDLLDNKYREIVRKGRDYFLLVNIDNEFGVGMRGNYYNNGYLLPGTDQWEHLVGIYSGVKDSIYLYFNGTLVHAFPTTTSLQTNTNPLRIGSTENSRQNFAGTIDDVLLYNRAISEQEVQALYSGQVPPPPPPSPVLCNNLYCDGQNIGIGTSNTQGYKLAVAGDIISEKVKVALQDQWPDYVFDEDYDLQDLQQLEQYIKTHKHLPNIPDAETIKEEGLDLGEMNARLLEKIEELSLYIIEQDKENQEMKKEIDLLKERLKKLENQ